jgi:hypothetical protein
MQSICSSFVTHMGYHCPWRSDNVNVMERRSGVGEGIECLFWLPWRVF